MVWSLLTFKNLWADFLCWAPYMDGNETIFSEYCARLMNTSPIYYMAQVYFYKGTGDKHYQTSTQDFFPRIEWTLKKVSCFQKYDISGILCSQDLINAENHFKHFYLIINLWKCMEGKLSSEQTVVQGNKFVAVTSGFRHFLFSLGDMPQFATKRCSDWQTFGEWIMENHSLLNIVSLLVLLAALMLFNQVFGRHKKCN